MVGRISKIIIYFLFNYYLEKLNKRTLNYDDARQFNNMVLLDEGTIALFTLFAEHNCKN